MFNPTDHPHRRYNPLTGEYVLVSPHRTQRPWQGKVERPPQEDRPPYDPEYGITRSLSARLSRCGSSRSSGEIMLNFF